MLPVVHRDRIARRRLLAGAAGSVAVVAVGGFRDAWAAASEQPPDLAFLRLSVLVTGRANLDREIGRRLRAVLSATIPDFDAQVSACATFAIVHRITKGELLMAALQQQEPTLATTVHAIVSAWYVGVAGAGPQTKVIAYRDALMFASVSDVLAPPSYCAAAPGDWTAQPPSI